MNVPDSIIEKVKKLLKLASRPGTIAEAENAMARVQEILLKYNLDIETVNSHQSTDGVLSYKGNFNNYQFKGDGKFSQRLLTGISYFNFCKIMILDDSGNFVILGKKHNLDITHYLFDYCLNSLKILFKSHWKEFKKEIKISKQKYRKEYYRGAVEALAVRLQEQQNDSFDKFGKENVYGLIVKNNYAVEKRMKEMFPESEKEEYDDEFNENEPQNIIDGYSFGYYDAYALSLSKGLTNDNNKNKKLKDKIKLIRL